MMSSFFYFWQLVRAIPTFPGITLFFFSKEAVRTLMDRGFGYKFPQVNRIKIWRKERQGL